MSMVSIIMPSYNCAPYIADSIRSVLAQTYNDWELIIIDDYSTDETESVVSQFIDPRIRYFKFKTNRGAAEARNYGLKQAKGRWIAFLDSDDLWTSDKLEHQLKFMIENEYFFSYHKYEEIDENGFPLDVMVSGKKRVSKIDMYACCWPGCLTVMYDSGKIGLLQIENIRKNNDTALWLKAIKKADCFLLNESLGYYRRRTGSITPPDISSKIKWHYTLFRQAEKLNPVVSAFWMIINVFGNCYKKLFYVKHNVIKNS